MSDTFQAHQKMFCTECIVHTQVPGVEIDENGLCNGCKALTGVENLDDKVSTYFTRKMESLFEKKRNEHHIYDAMLLFSGGKDCAKLLTMANREFGLRVLAFSVITPFVTEVSSRNMEDATKKLNVDLMKFFVDPEIFRVVIRHALLHGEDYGLAHNAACQVCYFFIYWTAIRIAMQMDIPIVLGGRDKSQRLNTYVPGESARRNIEKGILPFGSIHKLFADAVGDKYGRTVFHFDERDVLKCNYPTEIAPLSFMTFAYKDIEADIESAGLMKRDYKKLFTGCQAIHFFDYFSFVRYDCPCSINEWANGLRMKYPELMQLDLKDGTQTKSLSRAELLSVMQEYRNVIFYVAENQMSERNISAVKRQVYQMCKTSRRCFSEEAFSLLVDHILQMHSYAEYFDISLDRHRGNDT